MPYTGTVEFNQILQNWSADGRVNSWFDHKYPDSGSNNGTGLWLFTNPLTDTTKAYWSGKLRCFDQHCYDGHDGIDIKGQTGLEIRAAFVGTVAAIKAMCPEKEPVWCDGGFGKFVVLYHQVSNTNGYFSLYGHLSAVDVVTGTQVSTGQRIGAMGSTGNSGGPHLHFGVYRDDGDSIWEGGRIDRPVDPYGYRAAQSDPWVSERGGPPSYRLWIHDPANTASTNGQALTLVGATQNITAIVGANRFPGQATLELMPGPVAGTSAQLRQAGQSFWLTLVEWIQGLGSTLGTLPTDTIAATNPITVTVKYSEAQAQHLDMSQAAIYRWDEAAATWQALPTTLVSQTRTLMALSPDVGQFSPQAPLLCPADTAEPDDDLYRAMTLSLGGASTSHVLDGANDEDWYVWEGQAGVSYVIQTQGLAAGVDTMLEIRDVSGQTLLASDDDSGGGAASRLTLKLSDANLYFARVIPAPGSAVGCAAHYALALFVPRVYLPTLIH